MPDLTGNGRNDIPTREGYDRWAEIYDEDDNPLILLETAEVARRLGDVRGLCVADIGCGTGRHALGRASAGAAVTALDVSEGMLAKARAKPGADRVRFIQHDLALPLPLDGGAFDRVTCCLVLDHIDDLTALFGEMRRICKAGGFVLISVMHPAMMLKDCSARFIDPATGERTRVASVPNQIADYVMATTRTRLVIDHISEHAADAPLVARSPRAEKYLGWPLLLMMRLRPGD